MRIVSPLAGRLGADKRPIYVDGEVNAVRGENGFSDDSPVYVKIGRSKVGLRLIDRFVCSREHPPPKLVSVRKGYGRVGEACGRCSSQGHSIVSLVSSEQVQRIVHRMPNVHINYTDTTLRT